MQFLDTFKKYRPISNMQERMTRMAYSQPFHKIGPFLKGKIKIIRGNAYLGVKKVKNGRTFIRMDDRVYQTDKAGTYYRCRVMRGQNGKTEIRPRF